MSKTLDFFKNNAQIDSAKHCAACGYTCCTLDENNFIVLFPWERDEATRVGLSMAHLPPMQDNNPLYVNCVRPCTGLNDYKPINCATYPMYPLTTDLELWVRGAKNRCPIANIHLRKQIKVIADGLRKIEFVHPGSIKTLVDFTRIYKGELELFEYGLDGKKLSPTQITLALALMRAK